MKKKLYRSSQDKKILGVCGGIAEYFEIDSTIVRLAWLLLTVFAGLSIWIYIIAAIIMPNDPGYTPYSDVNNKNGSSDNNTYNGENR